MAEAAAPHAELLPEGAREPLRPGLDAGVSLGEIDTASGHRFGHATLDAPATLNALSLPMTLRLGAAFERWLADPQVAGIVLDGAGDRAFCAGGDVAALQRAIRATPDGEVPQAAADFFEHEYRLDHRIHSSAKPVLCWGHGIVMGGGIGLMAGASHRVATPRTRMAMPEISIGLYPDVGGSWFLPRMPGRLGVFLALTGAPLNAADARFAGLADVVLRQEDKAPVLDALAGAHWSGERARDAALLSHLLAQRSAGVDAPASLLRAHLDTIDAVIGHDTLADIAPRLRALETSSDAWLSSAARSFGKGSPTSAALAFELLRRARHLSLADVFRLEYQVSVACCVHADFAEGVRALLIDKDRNPRWRPATLEEVDPEQVADHFKARHAGAHPLADLT